MKPRFTIILLSVSILTSCVYFNTFYNTKKLYNEARKEREARTGDKPTSAENNKYNQTIEKASKILELHPNSKYVDDAVFILGECFYHKQDYVKAKRKFEELINYFPDSDYFHRSKLWLAKTNIKLQDYLSAGFKLTELLESEDVNGDIQDEAHFLLAEIQFDQDRILEAETIYSQVVEDAKKKSVKADAYFKLGLCQLRLDYYYDAGENFKSALKLSTNPQFAFQARLHYARALKLSNEFAPAKIICTELLEDQSLKENHGLVKLELADCLYYEGKSLNEKLQGAELNYLGKIEEALDEYKRITLEYKRTEVAAEAYFRIGKIYEDDFGDFASAKEYYEKVKFEYGKSEHVPVTERRSKDLSDLMRLISAVSKSQEFKARDVGSAVPQFSELELLLLEHGVHPELRFMKKKQKVAQIAEASQSDSTANGVSSSAEEEINSLIESKLQLAELYLFQFGHIDSALAEYDEIIELFPDHPLAASAIYSKAFVYENEFQDKEETDSLLYLLVHRFPDSYQAQEARRILGLPLKDERRDPASELYKNAENSLFARNNLNKAIREFERIFEEYPQSVYAPKALYALGWIHEQMRFDNDKALEIYQEIVKAYPDSEYSTQVRKKIDSAVAKTGEEVVQQEGGTESTLREELADQTTPAKRDSMLDAERLRKSREAEAIDDLLLKPKARDAKKPIKQ